MATIGNIVGSALGLKLVNGKIKPKFGIPAIIILIVFILFYIALGYMLVDGVIDFNVKNIFISILGFVCFGYVFLISPYFQKSGNYYIEFVDEHTIENFKLFYKGKQVAFKYKLGSDGKIAFDDNNNKLDCLSYADESKMSNFTKYRIINYFSKWLHENDLLSNDVTITFEKL